jgi:deoxyadenosine/deoxycytidine kinase
VLKNLLKRGMEIDAQDERGNTLLHKLFSYYSQYYTTYYQSLDLIMNSA